MTLISYGKIATNKRLLIYENQCTFYRRNPTNMPHVFHARSAYDHRPYVSYVVHA
jgi:hypothetical protein